jgi:cobalt-zinc-cadmium resistance protein CzcA
MIEKLLDAAIRFRWGVVIATLIVAAFGAAQLLKLPIDAVPDITNKQVQINTVAPALGPLDMERLVTFPVETAMAGIPGLESSRSISRNGFSQVTVVFEDQHRPLFRAPAGCRTAQSGQGTPARRHRAANGAGDHRAWRSADVCRRL